MKAPPKKKIWQELGSRLLVAASLSGKEHLVDSARRAEKLGADLIEIRVDTLKPKERANIANILKSVKAASSCPIIVTVRGAAEQCPGGLGGSGIKSDLSDHDRKSLYENCLPLADCVDVEIESQVLAHDVAALARKKGKKVILSYHDFSGIPTSEKVNELLKVYSDLGGDILKVAAMAKAPTDVIKIFELCKSLNSTPRIFIAMGEVGGISRASGFLYGSCMTYGYMNKPTAPGQISVEKLIGLCALFYPKKF